MSLTKSERDALPEADFAVPAKRALPMHDAKHVRMAWDMVERTKDLTDAERSEARRRILHKAKELGVDTSDWSTLKAMALDAMSLNVPATEGHPNKMPFRGVLTRIDQPSDMPPNGSGGRRVMLPRDVAAAALPSLLGMAVDFTPSFDGHDAQKKIGIIDEAVIEGDAIHVGGFVYAADFPDTAASIRANKDRLGFSYEMKNVRVADPSAETLVIESCVFTGAAILNKADAAYKTTSLAASQARESETIDMTKEELEAIIAGALKPVTDEIAAIKAGQEKVATDLAASKETHSKVAPHADKLRACADGMQAAGIGTHETRGHVAHLRQMADRMEAEAMLGKIPHIYRDHDFFVDAGAEKKTEDKSESPDVKALKDEVATLTTKLADLSAAQARKSPEPERKTVSPEITSLMSKFSLEANADGKVSVDAVDKTLEASGATRQQRIETKLKLREAGLLA